MRNESACGRQHACMSLRAVSLCVVTLHFCCSSSIRQFARCRDIVCRGDAHRLRGHQTRHKRRQQQQTAHRAKRKKEKQRHRSDRDNATTGNGEGERGERQQANAGCLTTSTQARESDPAVARRHSQCLRTLVPWCRTGQRIGVQSTESSWYDAPRCRCIVSGCCGCVAGRPRELDAWQHAQREASA